MNSPAIRFAGFAEDWEERKLGDLCCEFRSGEFIKASDITPSGNYPVYGGNGLRGHANIYNHDGDFALIGRQGALCGNMQFSCGKAYFTEHAIAVMANNNNETRFLYYLFGTMNLGQYSGQSAQPGLAVGNLNELKSLVPLKAEQKKVSGVFSCLDRLITLHQREHDKTVNIKKALLEKMFPKDGEDKPEIRFAGFTDAWEQRQWIDTIDISTNMVDPKNGKYDFLPHIGPGNIESFSGRLFDNVNTVKEDNLISGKFHFNKGDVIYGKINPQLGKYIFAPFEGLASADAYVLNARNGIEQTFLFTLLQTSHFFKYSVSVSMRSGMPKINRDELNEYKFNAPSEKEQERIGELFLSLDRLIALHQRELTKLQNIKKALLEKMFV